MDLWTGLRAVLAVMRSCAVDEKVSVLTTGRFKACCFLISPNGSGMSQQVSFRSPVFATFAFFALTQ